MPEVPKGPSIRLQTDLTSYTAVKYNKETGEIEVGGKKYEVLVKHGGQYKAAQQNLSKEELKNLIGSIESLFKDTKIEFFSLSDVVIDDKGVHSSGDQEKVKIVKDANLSTLAQKVTQLAKGVQFSEPAPTVPKKKVVEKEIGEKEEYTPLNKSIPDLLKTPSNETFDSQTIKANQKGVVDEKTITALGTIDKRGVEGSPGNSAEYNFLSNFYVNPNGYSIPLNQLLDVAGLNTQDVGQYESYASLPSMEHYYQAIKVLGIQDTEMRQQAFAKVVKAKTPDDAKGVAKKYEENLKKDYWSDSRVADSLNLILMYKFVEDPFEEKIKLTKEGEQLLVMTEGKAIIEGIQGTDQYQDQRCAMELHSDSKDGYEFKGKNMLGKKLMQIRDLLTEEFEVKDTSE